MIATFRLTTLHISTLMRIFYSNDFDIRIMLYLSISRKELIIQSIFCSRFNSQVSGVLQNTGQSLVFRVDKDTKQHVNISGGPLAYRYQFEEIYIHYGTENIQGSEHHIHGYSFPGEVSTSIWH